MIGKPYILVVDDDQITNFITEKVIKRWNPNVEVGFITTIDETIAYLSEPNNRQPDLLLLDINLVGGTGWEILDSYSEMERKIEVPIVMVSSSVYQEDKVKSNAYKSVIGFQEKPISQPFLEKYIQL